MNEYNVTERIKAIIEERFGIHCTDDYDGLLSEIEAKWRRRGIVIGNGCESEISVDDLRELARDVTVGETYFFREVAQLEALTTVVIPELLRRNGNHPIRILSAGCASGEEAYSIAIALQEQWGPLSKERISITGIDINPAAITKARRARYSPWALRATPQNLRERYFRRKGKEYCLRDEIRGCVTFEERNLLGEDATLWACSSFDIVFCRNVLIYFSDRSIRNLIARFADVLVPGGILFLGHSEYLDRISSDFERIYMQGAFCYVRNAPPGHVSSWPENSPLEEIESPAEPLATDSSVWVKMIEDSSHRIELLVKNGGQATTIEPQRRPIALAPHGAIASIPHKAVPEELDNVLRPFHEERFDEALTALRGMSGEIRAAPHTKVLLALILCNRKDIEEGEAVCREVIEADAQNGPAHYVLGLCREQLGDITGAAEHYYDAILADPSFALAHLHLGILLRRAGDSTSAFSALSRAVALLPKEKDERIRLFGGGFRREALMTLCQAEIHNLIRKP